MNITGFGASVLSKLVTTSVKRNLFYEIKDRVIEERTNGINTIRKTQRVKVYGLDSTKDTRELLMQILRDRMDYHKDKFTSPIIFSELETLEVKKNGRIEHSSNGHDDQIFSYLLALYIWYEGKDLMERYGIQKRAIRSDEDAEEAVFGIEEKYDSIIQEIESEDNELVKSQLDELNKAKSMSYEQWIQSQDNTDQEALNQLLATPLGRKAYSEKYNVDEADIENSNLYKIPDEVFRNFYSDNPIEDIINKNFDSRLM